MKAIVIRDKTLDWFERIFDGRNMETVSWAVIALAVLYFGARLLSFFWGR